MSVEGSLILHRCQSNWAAIVPRQRAAATTHSACSSPSTSLPRRPQEYLGSYVSDEAGRLVFREGLLVQVK